MTVKVGSFGRIRVFEEFLAAPDVTTGGTTALTRVCNLTQLAVGAPTLAQTVDEPGGILSISTGNTDDNNCVLYAGPFKPSDGGCWIEARFKLNSITLGAVFCGFTETLATTPVMPAESSTGTLDLVATGGVVGMLFDPDDTTDIWKAVAGQTNVAATDAPTSATTAIVADEWDIVRVEITSDKGDGDCYLNGVLIKSFPACVTPGDIAHAVLMVENRASTVIMEVDYFYAEGARDWTIA